MNKKDINYSWMECNQHFKDFWLNNTYYPRSQESFDEYSFELFCAQYGDWLIKEWVSSYYNESSKLDYVICGFQNAPCKANKLSILKTHFIYDDMRSISDRKNSCIFNNENLDNLIEYCGYTNHQENSGLKIFIKENLHKLLEDLVII